MGQTLKREPCNVCMSQDNLVTWEHEGKQFTKCKTPNCVSIQSNDNMYHVETINYEVNTDFITGEYQETRGLSRYTCEKVGIKVQDNTHIFIYNEAQKVRISKKDGKKDMYWQGNQKNAGLFGAHLSYDYEKEIIITEGEFDAATLIQVGYQAYSVNSGADGGSQEIQNSLETLNKFREIIIWYDSDVSGQKGLKKILAIEGLALHKVKIVSSMYKDANEVLTLVHSDHIHEIIKDAEEYVPNGLQYGSDLDFSILEQKEELGISFPFKQLNDCYHGLRPGEILLIGAGSGAGKSLFAKHLVLHWMQTIPELRIGNIFLEEKQKFTLQSLLGLSLKVPAHILMEQPYKGLEQKAINLLGSKKYIFDNHFGSLQSKELFNKIRYLAFKTDVIILDHISIIVSGMEGNDERKDIDRLMTKLKTIAIETGVRFVLISHLRRANGDATYEQGMPITSNSFRGSHSLYQLSDSVISLERNQQDTIIKNMVQIRALKNRFKGNVGLLDELCYNEDTGCLTSLEDVFK